METESEMYPGSSPVHVPVAGEWQGHSYFLDGREAGRITHNAEPRGWVAIIGEQTVSETLFDDAGEARLAVESAAIDRAGHDRIESALQSPDPSPVSAVSAVLSAARIAANIDRGFITMGDLDLSVDEARAFSNELSRAIEGLIVPDGFEWSAEDDDGMHLYRVAGGETVAKLIVDGDQYEVFAQSENAQNAMLGLGVYSSLGEAQLTAAAYIRAQVANGTLAGGPGAPVVASPAQKKAAAKKKAASGRKR